MELYLEERVEDYLIKKGWKLHFQNKIRGIRPDFVAEKEGKLAMVEVKGERADLGNGIKKVLHFRNAANYAYLAMPSRSINRKIVNICEGLGIGLISIDQESKEIVRPELTKALESVKNKVLQIVKEKPKIKRKGLLVTLFRSKTFVYILNFLFLNQTRRYYLNELAYHAGVSASTVSRELEKIQPLDIVTKTKESHIVFYKINRNCIIYEELKRIFLKFELTDEIISKELENFDIKYALIYGSFARGIETETSDMDLLIIGDVERALLLRSISKLENKIGREINFILWNEKEFERKKEKKISLLKEIKENEIIMIKGDEDEFKGTIE